MSEKAERKVYEILKFPKTKEQKMSLIFYFESPREEVVKVLQKHHAKWIIKALMEYPLQQRKILYEKIMEKLKAEET